MDFEQFTYWLQGYFELTEDKDLSEKQVEIIKDHLALVFDKQTPDRSETPVTDLSSGKVVESIPHLPRMSNRIKPWSPIKYC
jgi:hypothetical protein